MRYAMVFEMIESVKTLGVVAIVVNDMIRLAEGTLLHLNDLIVYAGMVSQTAAPASCLPKSIRIRHHVLLPCQKRERTANTYVATCSYHEAWKKRE